MHIIRNSLVVLCLLFAAVSPAQKKELITAYIETYKDLAIAEMQRTGVPAAITLAQGIHESGAGNSKLVLESNNHFGIKCKSNWTGETVQHDDDAKGECFRKYPLAAYSYKDHSDFLKSGQRYAFLFDLDPTDYEGWANGLKKAGYATNPKYPQVLIKLIEDYKLQDYTFIALGKQPAITPIAAVNDPGTENNGDPAPVVAPAGNNNIASVKEVAAIYPEGEFKLNETKVVYVKKGTSFLSLAKQYDVDLSKIFEFNDMDRTESADKDQLVYLQRKRRTGANDIHIVQPGETLQEIAQLQAIRLESLRELNWLKENEMPAVGEKLFLKTKSANIPKLVLRENYRLFPVSKNK